MQEHVFFKKGKSVVLQPLASSAGHACLRISKRQSHTIETGHRWRAAPTRKSVGACRGTGGHPRPGCAPHGRIRSICESGGFGGAGARPASGRTLGASSASSASSGLAGLPRVPRCPASPPQPGHIAYSCAYSAYHGYRFLYLFLYL